MSGASSRVGFVDNISPWHLEHQCRCTITLWASVIEGDSIVVSHSLSDERVLVVSENMVE